jgi:TRAP-type mannitol/chloroaromatic compound transport system permease small subunit
VVILNSLAQAIDRLNRVIGHAVAWLTALMVLSTVTVVLLRYWFDMGWIWMQESVTWAHAAVFMLAAAYTLAADEHVRVDIFYRSMSARRKALVNALGVCLFLIPVAAVLFWYSLDYVFLSWRIEEASNDAGGLAYPFPALMKTFIPLMSLLLILQGLAMLIRSTAILRDGSAPASTGD